MVSRSFSGRSSLLRILQTPRPRNNVLPALHPIPCLCRAASSKKSQPETSKDPSEPSNSKRTAPVTFSAQDSATEGVVRRFLSEQGLLKPSETQETIQQISVRTRPKLPTAKAKAQASRALREQVAASHIPGEITGEPGVERSTTEAAEMGAGAQLREVVAYATAEEYDLDALIRSGRLPAGWKLLEDDEVLYIPAWPIHASQPTTDKSHDAVADGASDSGEAFIFRSGSYVTWGMSEDQSRRFLPSVIRGRVAKFEVERERYTEIGDEGMDYLFAADQHTRIVGDILVIGQPPRLPGSDASDLSDAPSSSSRAANDSSPWTPLLARLAFSQGLARSARLSVQEGALSTYLASVAPIPAQLETQGRVPLPRKEVVRRMGTLLKLRQRANLDKENFLDDPEIYWENGRMEYHYRSICAALDIGPRFSALNEKLNHCENLLEVLRALLTEGSSHRMELIIIYLIAFEATIALISHDYIPTPQRILNLLTGRVEEPKEEEGGKLEESVAALRKLLAMPRGGSETETHARIPPSPDAAAAAASRAQANVRLV